MYLKNIILVLAILSLLVLPQRGIAEPVEIVPKSLNIKVYAFEKVLERWSDDEWDHFNELIDRESRWNCNAQNPKSTAYGCGQFLNSTWETVGCTKTSDKYKQIDCAIAYVEVRYDTPQKALKFHKKNNWY